MSLNLEGQSILVVDDERYSRTIVAHVLRDLGGPNVVQAQDGVDALEALDAAKGKFAFVISDFNMPRMHGLQLLKEIRVGHGQINRAMPFAMVTGFSEKHLVDLALALDVNAFLVKPVSKRGLEKRLEKMLRVIRRDLWLKYRAVYDDIPVDSVLDELTALHKGEKRPTFPHRGIFVKGENTPLLRDAKPVEPEETESDAWAHLLEEEAEESEHIVETPLGERKLNGYECALDDIPKGAILARDLHTSDGRLFMHAGAQLSPRIISILYDLRELKHPVDSIWVAR